LLREVYLACASAAGTGERKVMESKPVLPAPVPQALVSLSKGARNDLIP
jgi:hypothetical protein